MTYGLHPDCVGGTRYSADYPHHLTQVLRLCLHGTLRAEKYPELDAHVSKATVRSGRD